MLRSMMMVGLLCGAVATTTVAMDTSGSHAGWHSLVNSRIGKLISGNIGRLLVLRSELNVSPEQRKQIGDVLKAHRTEIVKTVKQVRAKRVALREAVLSGQASESAIRAAAQDLGSAIADAAVKASRLRNDIAPILTAKQRSQIKDFLKDRDQAVDSFLDSVGNK